ncbi:DUF4365 domain-containing protein [Nocardia seriolae]|uniref:DUF4365 domain-containing protein n=1 Tax=Nocardia seriolae TaxID=37332 RepID=UPI00051A7501|nr:DUF4365 domain-containing protein [Nocardia seriolae]OJF84645.1 hypothetical protein NS14008_24260 [Nocardia seriolae]WKY50576.1 DUF4365 domain-containing protein [Nocardia seriolae]
MGHNEHQGVFGEGFVQALAASAGLQAAKPQPDCTGVDLDLTLPYERNDDFPSIRLQVKSWRSPILRGDHWHYPELTEKHFDALAGKRRIPRFLVLVIVPKSVEGYTLATPWGLTMAHAAYWVSLENEARITNPRTDKRKTVRVPFANLLTVHSLLKLLDPGRGIDGP